MLIAYGLTPKIDARFANGLAEVYQAVVALGHTEDADVGCVLVALWRIVLGEPRVRDRIRHYNNIGDGIFILVHRRAGGQEDAVANDGGHGVAPGERTAEKVCCP